ncbi:type II toxin-antitoxin system RelE/ParE family toxin [Catenuloplanes japonicus]|uniref:type II toxin-antitoxin system RelE/ParE family toxin n=1 Tax=Catenuloplanes japonicus TaxID=33876 RepID=UPI000526457A|nr:type II toxin-antitoxin system RelE/ParE family toxin [Catenuloplanes japonicus]
MIQSFADADTAKVWRRLRAPGLGPALQRVAHRKLLILDAAESVNDLRSPPGNRLEKLSGDRAGHFSIRINERWRISFAWTDAGPADVEIVDYH